MKTLMRLLGLDRLRSVPEKPKTVRTIPIGDLRRCVVFMGGVRTGTTVFRRMLATHPRITDHYEMFNANTADGFYPFYLEHLKSNPKAIFPEQNLETLTQYLLQLNGADDLSLVDIKYEHLGHLPGPWRMPFSPPALIHHIEKLGLKVIHLRRNPFHSLLSNEVAKQTKRYKRYRNEEATPVGPPEKVRVDRETLAADIAERRQITRMVDALIPAERRLSVDYEQMLDASGQFDAAMCAEVARFLKVDNQFDREPGLEKVIAQPLSEVIENYAEIADLEYSS